MSEEASSAPKVKFNSRYSPGKRIHAGQYIAELMCERRSKQIGYSLPDKFWELPNWKKYFLYQTIQASKLLKEYPVSTILTAMRNERCNFISSINSPVIRGVCAEVKTDIPIPPEDIDYVLDSKGTFRHKKSFLDNLDG